MEQQRPAFLDPPPRGGLGPAVAVLALTLGVYLAAGVALAASGGTQTGPDGTKPHGVLLLLTALAPFAAGLCALLLAVRALLPDELGRMLSVAGRLRWGEVARGVLCWALVVIAPAAALAVLSGEGPAPLAWVGGWRPGDVALVLGVGLLGFAVQTFAEEALFRGFLLRQSARSGWRPAVLVALNAGLFAAVHLPGGAALAGFAALSGAAFATVTLARGGIEAAWGGHLVHNVVAGVALFGPLGAPVPTLDWTDWALAVASLSAFTGLMIWRRPPGALSGARQGPA